MCPCTQLKAEGPLQGEGGPCIAHKQCHEDGEATFSLNSSTHKGVDCRGIPQASLGANSPRVRSPAPQEVADGVYIHIWIMQGKVRGGSPLPIVISWVAVFFKLWGSWIRWGIPQFLSFSNNMSVISPSLTRTPTCLGNSVNPLLVDFRVCTGASWRVFLESVFFSCWDRDLSGTAKVVPEIGGRIRITCHLALPT